MERIRSGRTKWLKAIVISLGAVRLVVLVVLFYRRMGPLPNWSDRDLAGATTITSEWLEIKADPALKFSGKTPLVILKLEGYAPDFGSQKLRYPDGTLAAPDMQLIDDQGNVFPL